MCKKSTGVKNDKKWEGSHQVKREDCYKPVTTNFIAHEPLIYGETGKCVSQLGRKLKVFLVQFVAVGLI